METNNSALKEKHAFGKAKMKAKKLREFYAHLRTYLIINLLFFLINWIDYSGEWWALYPLIGWGMCVTIHALDAFKPFEVYDDDWEERKTRELVKRFNENDY